MQTKSNNDLSPDRAPDGHVLASNRQAIDASDMVFVQATPTTDAQWAMPRPGHNIIGATIHELWPAVMALAVKR